MKISPWGASAYMKQVVTAVNKYLQPSTPFLYVLAGTKKKSGIEGLLHNAQNHFSSAAEMKAFGVDPTTVKEDTTTIK